MGHRLQDGGHVELGVGGLGDFQQESVLVLGRQFRRGPGRRAGGLLHGGRSYRDCPVTFAKPSLNWRIQFLGTEKPWPTLWSQTSSPFSTFER